VNKVLINYNWQDTNLVIDVYFWCCMEVLKYHKKKLTIEKLNNKKE